MAVKANSPLTLFFSPSQLICSPLILFLGAFFSLFISCNEKQKHTHTHNDEREQAANDKRAYMYVMNQSAIFDTAASKQRFTTIVCLARCMISMISPF